MGAVVLKAGSGWAGFRGNVDRLAIGVDSVTTTFDFELSAGSPAVVSALPPDTIGAIVEADSQFVPLPTAAEGNLVHRSVLSIQFEDTVSQTTRAALIHSIAGTVVGGEPQGSDGDGPYFVQVADDPTGANNLALGARLDSLPTVFAAYALTRVPSSDMTAYLKPVDGQGWKSWELDPRNSNIARNTWALEMIRAPWAWGCEKGESDTRVAVLDFTFHTEQQLGGNLVYTSAKDLTPAVGADVGTWHGDAVAELIAAHGNDSSGMTGVMWRGSLSRYDIHHLLRDPVSGTLRYPGGLQFTSERWVRDAMVTAVRGGARVLNMSMELRRTAGHITAAQRAQAQAYGKAVAQGMLFIEKAHLPLPLVVIAAGNSGVPAVESGIPQLVMHPRYGKYTLVVGAANFGVTNNVLSPSFSNYGSLVSLVAPGQNVPAIDPGNSDRRIKGTSFAAPLVSGVAGLVFSFDPTLTASEVKSFILAGAKSGGRTAQDSLGNTYPLLDAYGALKAVAGRAGEPLCGNRVWNDGNNNIIVQRDSGVRETIIQRSPVDYAAYVHAYHGGKRVDLGFSYEYDWNPLAHQFIENLGYQDPPQSDYSGAWLSYAYVADHDNQFYSSRVDTLDAGGGQRSKVQLFSSNGTLLNDLGSQHIPGTFTGPPDTTCVAQFPEFKTGGAAMVMAVDQWSGSSLCIPGPLGAWDSAPTTVSSQGLTSPVPLLATVAPQGDAVYVPVSIRHRAFGYGDLAYCPSDTEDYGNTPTVHGQCRPVTTNIDSAVTAMVYRVDTATKTWTLIPLDAQGATSRVNREINSLEISEDGKEMMVSMTRRASYADFSGPSACHDETLEWISIDQSPNPTYTPGTVILRVPVPQGAACGGWVEAGGTVSPARIGAAPTIPAPSAAPTSRKAKPRYIPLRILEARARQRKIH
jgi:hypothetical protein